jgi:hypothetical protein
MGGRALALVHPVHALAARLGSRDGERAVGRIDTGDLETALRQEQAECTGSASHVQHTARAEFVSDGGVHLQVAAVGLERVVDRGQSRVLE